MRDYKYWKPMNNLLKLREEKKLSQRALGEMIGVQQEVICRYETGAVVPRLAKKEKLAEALGCRVDEIY